MAAVNLNERLGTSSCTSTTSSSNLNDSESDLLVLPAAE